MDSSTTYGALDQIPLTYEGQEVAVVGLVACKPDEDTLKKCEAEGRPWETEYLLKVFGAFKDKETAEKWAADWHKLDNDLNHFVVETRAPLPIPIGNDNLGLKDMNKRNKDNPLAKFLEQSKVLTDEKVSEMQSKAEHAAKKGRVARRQQKRMQDKYLKKKLKKTGGRVEVDADEIEDASPGSGGATVSSSTGRKKMHVHLNRVSNTWDLVGVAGTEVESKLVEFFNTTLGRELCSYQDGVLRVSAEPGKALAKWAQKVTGEKEELKVYINAPGEKLSTKG